MGLKNNYAAGSLIFGGGVQLLVLLAVAEALYPNYSVANNYVSDLGVGVTAPIFNISIIIFGLTLIVGTHLIRELADELFVNLFSLAGIGAVCVGVFPETTGIPHVVGALLTFIFGPISAVYFGTRFAKSPFSVFSIVLGAVSLIAVPLMFFGHYMNLGPGGMERMIVYPVLAWCLCFSGFLFSRGKT